MFGFFDIPMMTIDCKRQVFQVHNIEQFVFLIADDPPMTCARLDHFGLSVGAEEELDEIARGERAWVPLLRAFYAPLRALVDEKRKELRRKDFTTIATDEIGVEQARATTPSR